MGNKFIMKVTSDEADLLVTALLGNALHIPHQVDTVFESTRDEGEKIKDAEAMLRTIKLYTSVFSKIPKTGEEGNNFFHHQLHILTDVLASSEKLVNLWLANKSKQH